MGEDQRKVRSRRQRPCYPRTLLRMCEWKEQALGNRPMPDSCAPDGGGAEERLRHKVKPLVLRSWGLSSRKCNSQLPIILEDCLVLGLAKGQAGDRDWNARGTRGVGGHFSAFYILKAADLPYRYEFLMSPDL